MDVSVFIRKIKVEELFRLVDAVVYRVVMHMQVAGSRMDAFSGMQILKNSLHVARPVPGFGLRHAQNIRVAVICAFVPGDTGQHIQYFT